MSANRKPCAARTRSLREWLLSPEAGFGGDGTSVPCARCKATLHHPTVDRYPIAGCDGGRYRRDNARPLCRGCQLITAGESMLGWDGDTQRDRTRP